MALSPQSSTEGLTLNLIFVIIRLRVSLAVPVAEERLFYFLYFS